MGYRLKSRRSAGKQLGRIVEKALRRAAHEVGDTTADPDGIHEARTSVKKVRAVLHLLRPAMGQAAGVQDARLRAVGHELSASRDAEAALESLAAIHARYRQLVTRSIVKTVGDRLAPRLRGAQARLRPARVHRTLRAVAQVLPSQIRHAANPASIEAGAIEGYRRARRAMRAVSVLQEDAGFHRWRRRVKDHWYQLRLLEALHPSIRLRIRRLRQLEQWLGEDHNLVLLRTTVAGAPSRFGGARTTAILLGCVATHQAQLRRSALRLGAQLFKPSPRGFAGFIARHRRHG